MTTDQRFNYRAIIIAPALALIVSLLLAALAGIFLGLFGSVFIDDPDSTSVLFDLTFLSVFVLPAYAFCGYVASRLAEVRPIAHAAIAGAILLVANIAMAFPADPEDPFAWTDAFCYLSVIPLAILGGKFASQA